jgi:hypothetical protein
MQYATSANSSFVEDRFHHPVEKDRPLKSSRPYLNSELPYHSREAQYAPRDMPPSARPGPAPPLRSSYSGDGLEREFVGPYPPLGCPSASHFAGNLESLRDGGRDRDRESLRERRQTDRGPGPAPPLLVIRHRFGFRDVDFNNHLDRRGNSYEGGHEYVFDPTDMF